MLIFVLSDSSNQAKRIQGVKTKTILRYLDETKIFEDPQ